MIIAIAHNKGGVGKTTLAINLADGLKPDLVIDQDIHKSISVLNGIRPKHQKLPVVHAETQAELISYLQQSDEGKTILIDCGGFDSDTNRLATAAADLVIVPANDDVTELIGLQSFDQVLSEISRNMGKHIHAKVVMCKTHPARSNFREMNNFLEKAQHLSRLNSIIPRRKDYPEAMFKGLGVLGIPAKKYGEAAKDMNDLITEIKELITLLS